MVERAMPDDRQLSLVIRSADGAENRHILDVTSMTSDAQLVSLAAEAAKSGGRLRLGDEELPVFDLRADEGDGPGDSPAAADGEAPRGSVVIGRRGAIRVALLLD